MVQAKCVFRVLLCKLPYASIELTLYWIPAADVDSLECRLRGAASVLLLWLHKAQYIPAHSACVCLCIFSLENFASECWSRRRGQRHSEKVKMAILLLPHSLAPAGAISGAYIMDHCIHGTNYDTAPEFQGVIASSTILYHWNSRLAASVQATRIEQRKA